MKSSYAVPAIAKEDGWLLSHLDLLFVGLGLFWFVCLLSLWALKLTCPILQFAKTWYVVGEVKSPPITACPTFFWAKIPELQYKWQLRYHNSGKKLELQLKTQDVCKRKAVEKGSHITRSLQVMYQKSVQNSTSQSIQVLKMHIPQWIPSCCILMQNYLITNKSCTVRIRNKVSVIKVSLY